MIFLPASLATREFYFLSFQRGSKRLFVLSSSQRKRKFQNGEAVGKSHSNRVVQVLPPRPLLPDPKSHLCISESRCAVPNSSRLTYTLTFNSRQQTNKQSQINSNQSTRIYCCVSTEKMTIYYYKSKDDGPFRGMPVVLNFTGSNCFLKCCKSEQKVSLQIAVSPVLMESTPFKMK